MLLSNYSSQPASAPAATGTEEAAIDLRGVSKKFGDVLALCGLNLTVSAGEIYGMLGPNGAGKSTTINLICGLLQPDEGSISVAAFNVFTSSLRAKQALGVVPQELALYTELNAYQNLNFFGRLYGLRGSELHSRINEVLKIVNLESRSKDIVGSFSGGMQRRLNIAAALLHRPRVVLMDEPTVGLDPQNRTNILAIVQSIAAEGTAVLYSTHYMDEVEQICQRIGIIDHGRLLVEGSLEELRLKSGGKQVITMRGAFHVAAAANAFDLAPGDSILKCSAEEIVLHLAGAESGLTSLLKAASRVGDVREVAMNRQSLESLFIQLTGRELRE
jgi:ABC-2 type transport system ATP-binding protein